MVIDGEEFYPGKIMANFIPEVGLLQHCVPQEMIELNGWKEDISGVREFSDLPREAQIYLQKISEFGQVDIAVVSVGPERDQTIIMPGQKMV